MVSIIIAYHNEGELFREGVHQMLSTIDVEPYEIIVVDDCSSIPPPMIDGVKIIRHQANKGVGAAFDTGVASAQYDNIFIAGADIRYIDNKWASLMLQSVIDNPTSLICAAMEGLNPDDENGLDIRHRMTKKPPYQGATLEMFHTKTKNKKIVKTILSAKWKAIDKEATGVIPIPCLLGAFYGVKKEWYRYINKWWGSVW
jgi:glycosyltransferase involved in cell wall biosynthesis